MVNNTLQSTINSSQPYIEYVPLTAGVNSEPSVSISSIIRNSLLSPPMTWSWNRAEDSSQQTAVNPRQQDYIYTITNFGFLEKCSLIASNGQIFEVPTIYNTSALGKGGGVQRPTAAAIILNNPGTGFTLRFMGFPDQVYTIVLTYQLLPVQFQVFPITSVAAESGGNTVYAGTFLVNSFPIGSAASVTGFAGSAVVNNGTFTVVAVTTTSLTLNNAVGVSVVAAASVLNQTWYPIPDSYSDIYNNLFLSEAYAATDDGRSEVYRRRGVAAFLAKAEGLTDTQKNIFVQQWLSQAREAGSVTLKLQQGVAGRGV